MYGSYILKKKKLKLNNWLKNKLDERGILYKYTIISIVTEYLVELVDIIVTKSNINSNEISVNSLLSFAFRST